mmetsp:Transcript_32992/g.50505  ORF Transcript_32992/g.50505 Transcript_32992/m.50505 type:complete len:155 (+) Transcript_32992:2972-3436(+)
MSNDLIFDQVEEEQLLEIKFFMPSRNLSRPDDAQDIHPLAENEWNDINFLGKSQIIRESKMKLIMSRQDLEMLILRGFDFGIFEVPEDRKTRINHASSLRGSNRFSSSRRSELDIEVDDDVIKKIAEDHFATIRQVGREDIGDELYEQLILQNF